MGLKLTFTFEKETKNTYRYTEQVDGDEQPNVGTLYVRKGAFAARAVPTPPVEISVDITVTKE